MIDCPDSYVPYEAECPHCGAYGLYDYRYKGQHVAVYCVMCVRFIKHIPKQNSPKQAAEWRKQVKERDGYVCQKCGRVLNTTQLDAHHKMPVWFMKSLEFDLDNGITLCKKCHHALHGAGGTIKETED